MTTTTWTATSNTTSEVIWTQYPLDLSKTAADAAIDHALYVGYQKPDVYADNGRWYMPPLTRKVRLPKGLWEDARDSMFGSYRPETPSDFHSIRDVAEASSRNIINGVFADCLGAASIGDIEPSKKLWNRMLWSCAVRVSSQLKRSLFGNWMKWLRPRSLVTDACDFYCLATMAADSPDSPADIAFRALAKDIAEDFANYAILASGGEFRHLKDVSGDKTLTKDQAKKLRWIEAAGGIVYPATSGMDRYLAGNHYMTIFRMLQRRGQGEEWTLLKNMSDLFWNGPWSAGYGGRGWGSLVDVGLDYLMGNISPVMFVDLVFSIEHNGGQVLNKAWENSGILFVLGMVDEGYLDWVKLGTSDRFRIPARETLRRTNDNGNAGDSPDEEEEREDQEVDRELELHVGPCPPVSIEQNYVGLDSGDDDEELDGSEEPPDFDD